MMIGFPAWIRTRRFRHASYKFDFLNHLAYLYPSVCLSWQRGLHGDWTRSSSVRNSLRSFMYRHCAHRDIATCHRLSCCTQWTGVWTPAAVLHYVCSFLWQYFIERGELSKYRQRRHWDNGPLAEWRSAFRWAAQCWPICGTNDSLHCPVGLECQVDVDHQTLVTAGHAFCRLPFCLQSLSEV